MVRRPPLTLVSGMRQWRREARAAMQEASIRLPEWERMWMSARRDQT